MATEASVLAIVQVLEALSGQMKAVRQLLTLYCNLLSANLGRPRLGLQ